MKGLGDPGLNQELESPAIELSRRNDACKQVITRLKVVTEIVLENKGGQ